VRIGTKQFTVIGAFDKRPSPGNFSVNQDDFVVIPYTTYQRQFGLRTVNVGRNAAGRAGGGALQAFQISVVARDDVDMPPPWRHRAHPPDPPWPQAGRGERLRHRHSGRNSETLESDQPGHVSGARGDFLDRAHGGGIGVMAIMSISVTERTREIGVRRALGARRREVLFQFLIEAAVLTSVGGILGVLLGSAIGIAIHFVTGFPFPCPGGPSPRAGLLSRRRHLLRMFPAVRASRLDPIEALSTSSSQLPASSFTSSFQLQLQLSMFRAPSFQLSVMSCEF
jgi:hypothetical protein